MKNFIIALTLLLTSASFVSAECVNGTCSVGPVRKFGSSVVNVTRNIVTAPVRVVRRVAASPNRVRTSRGCVGCR